MVNYLFLYLTSITIIMSNINNIENMANEYEDNFNEVEIDTKQRVINDIITKYKNTVIGYRKYYYKNELTNNDTTSDSDDENLSCYSDMSSDSEEESVYIHDKRKYSDGEYDFELEKDTIAGRIEYAYKYVDKYGIIDNESVSKTIIDTYINFRNGKYNGDKKYNFDDLFVVNKFKDIFTLYNDDKKAIHDIIHDDNFPIRDFAYTELVTRGKDIGLCEWEDWDIHYDELDKNINDRDYILYIINHPTLQYLAHNNNGTEPCKTFYMFISLQIHDKFKNYEHIDLEELNNMDICMFNFNRIKYRHFYLRGWMYSWLKHLFYGIYDDIEDTDSPEEYDYDYEDMSSNSDDELDDENNNNENINNNTDTDISDDDLTDDETNNNENICYYKHVNNSNVSL